MKRLHHPSAERIRELLTYDAETGVFRARVQRRQIKPGDVVGCPTKKGYLRVWIDGESWYLHLLAWLYVFGDWIDELDHCDGNASNNAIGNLRPCDRSQNNANQRLSKRNQYGVKGVTYVARLSKWVAQIQIKGEVKYLGCYLTMEEAHQAYMAASREHFGNFARGR